MMKMNFSFIKNAGSAFLVLLFLCMGTFASAQSLTTSSAQELSVLKEYSNSLVDNSTALNIIGAELKTLKANTPNGGVAEVTHSLKNAFVRSAGVVLKTGGTVVNALAAGNSAAVAANGNIASGSSVSTDSILTYYAELLSL